MFAKQNLMFSNKTYFLSSVTRIRNEIYKEYNGQVFEPRKYKEWTFKAKLK